MNFVGDEVNAPSLDLCWFEFKFKLSNVRYTRLKATSLPEFFLDPAKGRN